MKSIFSTNKILLQAERTTHREVENNRQEQLLQTGYLWLLLQELLTAPKTVTGVRYRSGWDNPVVPTRCPVASSQFQSLIRSRFQAQVLNQEITKTKEEVSFAFLASSKNILVSPTLGSMPHLTSSYLLNSQIALHQTILSSNIEILRHKIILVVQISLKIGKAMKTMFLVLGISNCDSPVGGELNYIYVIKIIVMKSENFYKDFLFLTCFLIVAFWQLILKS